MNSTPFIQLAALRRLGPAIGDFVTGLGLPVLLITVTALYELFLIAVLLTPAGSGWWTSFAVDFKIWCFSYDARTETMRWAAVVIMFLEPLFITAIVIFVWRSGLSEVCSLRGICRHWRPVVAGTAIASLTIGGMYAGSVADRRETAPLPFPGERIRTQLTPPEFALHDHRGNPVDLADLRGTTVLITGVYALCSAACPHILIETRSLLDDLPPEALEHLSIIALSLNPENEDTPMMAAVANAYNLPYPTFRYLNGDPEYMANLLRRFQFSPMKNETTGEIDHANLFILIDASGHIAYRFNLDSRHHSWLRQAVIDLTTEARHDRLAANKGP